MTDIFRKHGRSLTSPPEEAVAILPDDAADLAVATRAVYVGGAGDLRVRMLGGGEVTLAAVPAGTLLPLRVVRILATGTSATALVGLW
jgi:hypothetical protein